MHIPHKDNRQCSYGFVTYTHVSSVPYAISAFAGTRLFDRELSVRNRNPNNNASVGHSTSHGGGGGGGYNNTNMNNGTDVLRGAFVPQQQHHNPYARIQNPFQHAVDHHDNNMRPKSPPMRQRGPAADGPDVDIQRLLQLSTQMLHSGGNQFNQQSSYNDMNRKLILSALWTFSVE